MADDATVKALRAGRTVWDEFRARGTLAGRTNSDTDGVSGAGPFRPDLRGVDLHEADLDHADLRDAQMSGADLCSAQLAHADLSGADLTKAKLCGANLLYARLKDADLSGADLTNANLACTTLVRTHLQGATLLGCRVYGAAVWDVDLAGAVQTDLVASPVGQPRLVTDSLEVAQFLYLLLKNARLRDVIDTIGMKAVLILGSFTEERKPVLDKVREALRSLGWVPILFDFEGPRHQDTSETVSTVAHLSRFVIADLTDPRSVPQELTMLLPTIPSVAVQPVIHASQEPWSMFGDLKRRYPGLLDPYPYTSTDSLLAALETDVIGPAEKKARELTGGR